MYTINVLDAYGRNIDISKQLLSELAQKEVGKTHHKCTVIANFYFSDPFLGTEKAKGYIKHMLTFGYNGHPFTVVTKVLEGKKPLESQIEDDPQGRIVVPDGNNIFFSLEESPCPIYSGNLI